MDERHGYLIGDTVDRLEQLHRLAEISEREDATPFLRERAGLARWAHDEIERLRAERDQYLESSVDYVNLSERLRAALSEGTTNGRWTEGEQCGEWAISQAVYETLRDAIADEQSKEPKP